MTKPAADLVEDWRSRLACDCPEQSAKTRESIIYWLFGHDLERLEQLDQHQLALTQAAMTYRYRILRQRYLGSSSPQAYRSLMTRLSSLVLVRQKIQTWVAMSRDRQRGVVDVLQEVLQELMQSDRYIQQQMAWIARCTKNVHLRNALLFASLEDYCLRPIRHQPLLVYRVVNYLRRSSRGGLTLVPIDGRVRLVYEEYLSNDSENRLSLLDAQALSDYQNKQDLKEQQLLRLAVQKEFANYLASKLGPTAMRWLGLYLQGQSQEAIAQQLNMSVKEVYRLREKINYHAVRVFALKHQSQLVSEWLETSLVEHNFGLTPLQWQQFWAKLTQQQRQLIELKKAGKDNEVIASTFNLKKQQVVAQWSQLYLLAQDIRSQE